MLRALALILVLLAPAAAGAQTVNFGTQSPSDPTTQPIENSGSANLTTGQVTVTTAPTQVLAARRYRNNVTVENLSTNQIFCGSTNVVTTTNGHLIPGAVGAAIRLDYDGNIWCVSTANSVVSFAEIYP